MLTNLKGEINDNAIIAVYFNTLLSIMNRVPTQKIKKETIDLTNTVDPMNLRNIYKIFHPTAEGYTFFSNADRTISRVDHICHRTNLRRLQSYQVYFLATTNETRNKSRKVGKFTNTWKLHHTLMNSHWSKRQSKENLKNILRQT